MSATLPILVNPRYAVSTCLGGETEFAVPFPFQFAADVLVMRERDGGETQLAIGADYVITGENEAAGGTLVLTAPAEAGDVIRRIGATVLERTSNMTLNGKYRTALLERDLDRLTLIAQEVNRDLQRAIKVALGQTAGELVPGAAGTLAVWADDGGLVEGLPAGPYDAALQALNLTKVAKAGDTMTGALQVPRLGVGVAPDDTNRFNARVSTAQWSAVYAADGGTGALRMVLNKEAAADIASVQFWNNWSARAEIGLVGTDDLTLKVSPDGAAWFDGMVIDRTTGRVRLPNTPVREVITANRTYYVRTDGSDSNTGLVNTSGGAFLTGQKAWDTIASLDLSIYSATIKYASGTYTGGINMAAMPVGGSGIAIEGDTATPANVHLNRTATCFTVGAPLPCPMIIRGFKLTFAGSGASAILVAAPGKVTTHNMELAGGSTGFGGAYSAAIAGAQLVVSTGQLISGNMSCLAAASDGGVVRFFGITVTLTGTPAFSWTTVSASSYGLVSVAGVTFSGAATGVRYSAIIAGGINTNGGGASFIPGNSAGSATSPAWYL